MFQLKPGQAAKHRLFLFVVLATLTPLVSGCAATALKPWDRDLLAKRKMQLNPSPMMTAIDEHIYFSKEASTGGHGVGGGGCGCN